MLFQTPVNSMTVSDQGGGGGRGGPKGPGLRSPTQSSSHTNILTYLVRYQETSQGEERGAKAALRKERKAGLCKDVRCQHIVK